jgi:hypothetical protein
MKRLRGSGTRNSAMNRDAPRPQRAVHGGSGAPLGKVHSPPPRVAVNDANYGGQKVRRK